MNKKLRYERQFGVQLEATDSYIDAILELLDRNKQSIRDLNNVIVQTLEEVEYSLLADDIFARKIILTEETVENNKKFTINYNCSKIQDINEYF